MLNNASNGELPNNSSPRQAGMNQFLGGLLNPQFHIQQPVFVSAGMAARMEATIKVSKMQDFKSKNSHFYHHRNQSSNIAQTATTVSQSSQNPAPHHQRNRSSRNLPKQQMYTQDFTSQQTNDKKGSIGGGQDNHPTIIVSPSSHTYQTLNAHQGNTTLDATTHKPHNQMSPSDVQLSPKNATQNFPSIPKSSNQANHNNYWQDQQSQAQAYNQFGGPPEVYKQRKNFQLTGENWSVSKDTAKEVPQFAKFEDSALTKKFSTTFGTDTVKQQTRTTDYGALENFTSQMVNSVQNMHNQTADSRGFSVFMADKKNKTNNNTSRRESIDQQQELPLLNNQQMTQTLQQQSSLQKEQMNSSFHQSIRNPFSDHRRYSQHNLKKLMLSEQFSEQQRQVDKDGIYKLVNPLPQSPTNRQQLVINQINSAKRNRTKTLKSQPPIQPSAKQYATMLAENARQERQKINMRDIKLESQTGGGFNQSAFVQRGNQKPITAYQMNKFKNLQRLKGLQREENRQRMMQFKKDQMSLYDNMPKGKMVKLRTMHQEAFKGKNSAMSFLTEETESSTSRNASPDLIQRNSNTDVTKVGTEQMQKSPSKSQKQSMFKEKSLRQTLVLGKGRDSLVHKRKMREIDAIFGDRSIDQVLEYLTEQHKRFEHKKTNISDVVVSYNEPSIQRDSKYTDFNRVFKTTIKESVDRLKRKLAGIPEPESPSPKKSIKPTKESEDKKIFALTKQNAQESPSPTRQRGRETQSREPQDFGKSYKLHLYSQKQIHEAYYKYLDIEKRLHYTLTNVDKYLKKSKKATEEVKITSQDIITEIKRDAKRNNDPNLKQIAGILEQPSHLSLIKLAIIYDKFNLEHDEEGLMNSVYKNGKKTEENQDNFSLNNMTSIGLMKELVREFGQILNKVRSKNKFAEMSDKIIYQIESKQSGTNPESPPTADFNEFSSPSKQRESNGDFHLRQIEDDYEEPDRGTMKNRRDKAFKSLQTLPDLGHYVGIKEEHLKHQHFDVISQHARESILNRLPSPEKKTMVDEKKRKRTNSNHMLALESFVQSNTFFEAFIDLVSNLSTPAQKQGLNLFKTTELISAQAFYKLTKDSVTFNTPDHPSTQFMKDCYNKSVLPSPLFSKIKAGSLNMIGYHVSKGICEAFKKFMIEHNQDDTNIQSLVLHSNGIQDASAAEIFEGLVEKTNFKHLHYSMNDFGQKSLLQIERLLVKPYPNQLKSLVLCDLKIYGKTVLELTQVLLKTTSLEKLVLKGISLSDQKAGENMKQFISYNTKLQILQLVNCKIQPKYLGQIAEELINTNSLRSLDLSKNVLHSRQTNEKETNEFEEHFVESLIQILISSAYLMHLNISGMFIPNQLILRIFQQGVMQAQSLAAIHFAENDMDHWSKLKIRKWLSMVGAEKQTSGEGLGDQKSSAEGTPAPKDAGINSKQLAILQGIAAEAAVRETAGMSKMSSARSLSLSDSELSADKDEVHDLPALIKEDTVKDISKAHGSQVLNNRKFSSFYRKLTSIKVDDDLQIKNIIGLIKSKSSLMTWPDSQNILDQDMFMEGYGMKKKRQDQVTQLDGGIWADLQGTLFVRMAPDVTRFEDKDRQSEIFKGAKWVPVNPEDGCWICNATRLKHRETRKDQTKLKNFINTK